MLPFLLILILEYKLKLILVQDKIFKNNDIMIFHLIKSLQDFSINLSSCKIPKSLLNIVQEEYTKAINFN